MHNSNPNISISDVVDFIKNANQKEIDTIYDTLLVTHPKFTTDVCEIVEYDAILYNGTIYAIDDIVCTEGNNVTLIEIKLGDNVYSKYIELFNAENGWEFTWSDEVNKIVSVSQVDDYLILTTKVS